MDKETITNLFKATLEPDLTYRQAAEKQLKQMEKIVGFPSYLMQILLSTDLTVAIKQSVSIYLKRIVDHSYIADIDDDTKFSIHENDKIYLRSNILDTLVVTPETIRNQLVLIVRKMIKSDYEANKWTLDLNENILNFLSQENNPTYWLAGLLTLLQLVKVYEFKKSEKRSIFLDAMNTFLPVLQTMAENLLQDNSSNSALLQKIILKSFYSLMQYNLPMNLFNMENVPKWMDIFCQILKAPVPEESEKLDDEERAEIPHWKAKKWVLHITEKLFEKYGKPGQVEKEYEEFAKYFMSSVSVPLLKLQLDIFESKKNGQWISPRVLQLMLSYCEQAINHSITWNELKGDNYKNLLVDILFPMMCFTDQDLELWNEDPEEYVREKFDVFEELTSAKSAAESFIKEACTKRKSILTTTMSLTQELLADMSNLGPEKIDGIFNLICTVSELLVKKKPYKSQLDTLTTTFFLDLCLSDQGYLRARGLYCIKVFCEANLKKSTIKKIFQVALDKLTKSDEQLPVQVEAAMALSKLAVERPEKAVDFMKKHIGDVLRCILELVNKTANDDLLDVVKIFITDFAEQVEPFAVNLAEEISTSFIKMANDEEGEDEEDESRSLAAIGMLTTLESLLDILEDNELLVSAVEEIVCKVIAWVFQHKKLDYYEEALSLLSSITTHHVSQNVWSAMSLLKEILDDSDKGGVDYFVDMMPALHNFVTVESKTFFSDQNNLQIVFGMIKLTLDSDDAGEDAETHALKLLEVLIFQAGNEIPGVIENAINLAYERAYGENAREIETTELRMMCLLVILAGLYYDKSNNTLNFLNNKNWLNNGLNQWIEEFDNIYGIHDRRLSILLMTKMFLSENKPAAILENANKILPKCLKLFEGLETAYDFKEKADKESEDNDENDEDAEFDDGGSYDDENNNFDRGDIQQLSDDESDLGDNDKSYLDMLKNIKIDEDAEVEGETQYEDYTTVIDEDGIPYDGLTKDKEGTVEQHDIPDEYILFTNCLENLSKSDPIFLTTLMGSLDEDNQKTLTHVGKTGNKRFESHKSKELEKQGGYKFNPNMAANIEFTSPGM